MTAERASKPKGTLTSLPNLISLGRLAGAPVLLVLAATGHHWAFLGLLAACLASDAVDGFLARRLGQTSELGAQLDSIGDFAIYVTVPVSGWLLWPEIMRREWAWFAVVVVCCIIPPLVALAKFGGTASYHTWCAKLAAAAVGTGVLLLFAGGPAWLFRIGVPLMVLAVVEEVAITLVIPRRRSNVRTLWHVLRDREDR